MVNAPEMFEDKVNNRTAAQDRRCALLAASHLFSNPNLLRLSNTPERNAERVTAAASVMLQWLEDGS
jgi:hypothetical protein